MNLAKNAMFLQMYHVVLQNNHLKKTKTQIIKTSPSKIIFVQTEYKDLISLSGHRLAEEKETIIDYYYSFIFILFKLQASGATVHRIKNQQ